MRADADCKIVNRDHFMDAIRDAIGSIPEAKVEHMDFLSKACWWDLNMVMKLKNGRRFGVTFVEI